MPYLSLFTSITPATADVDSVEGQPGVTLGTSWFTDLEGAVHAVRFYLGTRSYDGADVTAGLYDGNTGGLLAQKAYTISASDALGYVDIFLDTPIIVKRQYPYTVALFVPCDTSPDGRAHYSATSNFFLNSQFDNPPLHGYKTDGILLRRNGLYKYGSSLELPTESFNGGCYFIDVAFDYVNMVEVYNQSNGEFERHPLKVRVGGQWQL